MTDYLDDDGIISEREDGLGNRIERRHYGNSKDRLVVLGFDHDGNLRISLQVRADDHTVAVDQLVLDWLRTLEPTRHGLKLSK